MGSDSEGKWVKNKIFLGMNIRYKNGFPNFPGIICRNFSFLSLIFLFPITKIIFLFLLHLHSKLSMPSNYLTSHSKTIYQPSNYNFLQPQCITKKDSANSCPPGVQGSLAVWLVPILLPSLQTFILWRSATPSRLPTSMRWSCPRGSQTTLPKWSEVAFTS